MDTLTALLMVVIAVFMLWGLWHGIQKNPLAFSKQAMLAGAQTLGILALLLIGVITLCVWLLKA